eukprot:2488166-Prymnesium_polylepis.1
MFESRAIHREMHVTPRPQRVHIIRGIDLTDAISHPSRKNPTAHLHTARAACCAPRGRAAA